MKPYHFKTLRGRLTALLISPVVLILLAAGITIFIQTRNVMLKQWNESAMLQLERAAHKIEKELSQPVELMEMFSRGGADIPDTSILEAIVRRLETLPGVLRVNVNWHSSVTGSQTSSERRAAIGSGRFMRFHRGAFTKITPPKMDEDSGEQTVSITMILMDTYDTPVGHLEIIMKFDFLVAHISASIWWQNAMACIAERASGKIILTSELMQGRQKLGETGDPLEQKLLGEIDRDSTGTIWGSGLPPERVAGFHKLDTFPWALVVFADGETILSPIINFRNGFIFGATALILGVYTIIRFNADRMSGTIRHLSKRAEMIAAGDYGKKIPIKSGDEIGRLADSFNIMVDGLKERDMIRNTFGRYVDPDFARALLKYPEAGRLGGRRQEVAILMADISGFTPMAEHLSPEATIEVLNLYFSTIIPLVQKYQGIIVDFVGDAILAFFEPIDECLTNTTEQCTRCAFEMQEAIDLLNLQMSVLDLPVLNMGIGINCGPVVVGNIGSEARKKYGIVGAAVNITQRIQGQSYAGEVVVSEPVYAMVKTQVTVRRTFSTLLKGVASSVLLYAIAPDVEQHTTKKRN